MTDDEIVAHAEMLEISNKAIQCLKGLGYTFEQGEWKANSPEAKPVAWRWSPKGSSRWIYDPDIEWLNRQSTDEIDKEPLYSTPPAAGMDSAKSGVTAPVDMALFISSLVNDANISGDDLPHQVVEKLMAAAKGGECMPAAGMVSVPVEPTEEMIDAGCEALRDRHDTGQFGECPGLSWGDSIACYKAMLLAAKGGG